ncbi:hypothetical protein DRQ36_09845, partial [bacterium]
MTERAETKPKRGLLLTGGGAKGAFQIGALKYIIGESVRDYDIVSGFSVGALTGAMVAQGDFELLHEVWAGIQSIRDIFGGNLRFYKGFLTMKPLRKIVEKLLDAEKLRSSGKRFFYFTVDLQNGLLVERDETSEPLTDWLLASATIPGVFQPVEIDGRQYVDGGVMATNPLSPLIREGAEEIDIITCRPVSDWKIEERVETLVEVAIRSLELIQAELVRVDIEKCRLINSTLEKWSGVKDNASFVDEYFLRRAERKSEFPLKEYRRVKLNIIEPPSE